MTSVKIEAKITNHQQKQNTAAACGFLFDSNSTYTEYTIRVSITSPPLPFEPINVRRRFSEFRKLYTDVVELGLGPKVMARFPGRSPLKNNLENDFLIERVHGLQNFLDAILAAPIPPERLINWNDPISYFLSLSRLFTPPNDDHSERGGSLAFKSNEVKNLEDEFEDLKNEFDKLNSVVEEIVPIPHVPTMEQVREEASLRISKMMRGYLGRRMCWRLRLDRARPLYLTISSINGFTKGGNSTLSSFYSYSPFVMVSCYDGSSGKQLCAARTATRPATTETDWDWNADEMILLPVVFPDSVLVFTVLDQTSLGRHNLLAQASYDITRELADFTGMKTSAPPAAPPSSLLGSGGGGGGGESKPSMTRMSGHSSSAASSLKPPPPPPPPGNRNTSTARNGSVAARSSVDNLSSSAHYKPAKPPNVLELSLGDQKYDVWFEGCTQQSSLSAKSLTGSLSVSEHGARRLQAEPPYWSSNPEPFTKLRQWEFGTCLATVKWCPMHASKVGVLYRLSEPSSFRRQTWLATYVVLTQDEVVMYNNEGDSKAIRRRRVDQISKVAATSAAVVASGVTTPPNLADPWDAVITIQFENDEGGGDWQLLSLEGAKGQLSWRKIINEAIFHHASASRYSIGAGVSGSLTATNVAGFDLGFLPPSRSRLPSADSINSYANQSTASLSLKESAAHYKQVSDSPRTSLSENNPEFSAENLLIKPRSSSVEAPSIGIHFAPQPPPPPPRNKTQNANSKEPTLRLSMGL